MKQDLLKGLTEEQISRVKACKNSGELLKLAKEEGIELTDEQLEAVSGGVCTASMPKCPRCGSNEFVTEEYSGGSYHYCCTQCQEYWRERWAS